MSTRRDALDDRVKLYSAERTALYNDAIAAFPAARETERRHLIDRLDLRPGLVLCDTMAGGGYLSEGVCESLGGACHIVCVEPSINFAKSVQHRFNPICSRMNAIALPGESVDRVCNLAGTHHLERKVDFIAEAHRILRPGGRLAVADVLADSPPARFLNDAVDRLSDIGHDGIFPQPGELSRMLTDCGFSDVWEAVHRYTWDFADHRSMVTFCKSLFRLTRATLEQVDDELGKALRIESSNRGWHMEWSLVYVSGDKR